MYPLTITNINDQKELKLLLDFMYKQPQFYPKYNDWLYGKCMQRLESEEYKALIAIHRGEVIGDVVYHDNNDELEIKNFRIDYEYRNRALGRFLLQNVSKKGTKILLDVSANNFSGLEFFIRNGFHIKDKKPLYIPDRDEFILEKLA